MSGRLRATYELRCPPDESAEQRARMIAVEQTVEIPEGCFSAAIEERVVGRLESVEEIEDGRHRAVISYPVRVVGRRLGQLLNLLFGNVSMHRGIRLAAVAWPPEILDAFPGPGFGIAGLRELAGEPKRPLVCAAIKPLGLPVEVLARDAAAFAHGGIDLVKDDHSLDEQTGLAPFAERVARCQEAVVRANRESGGRTVYVPHLSGSPGELPAKVDRLRALGIRGVMVCPMIQGLETVRWLAADCGLFVLGHPSFSGALLGDEHGIAPALLYGHLFRLAGCDGVIFVNAGGRFAWSGARCDAIAAALREPLGRIRPSMPVPAGGMDVRRAAGWATHYGRDTMILIGGSLYQQGDLAAAAARLVRSVTAG